MACFFFDFCLFKDMFTRSAQRGTLIVNSGYGQMGVGRGVKGKEYPEREDY